MTIHKKIKTMFIFLKKYFLIKNIIFFKKYTISQFRRYVNNAEVTPEDVLEANSAYGCLGELAVLVLPQQQISNIIRK